MTNWEKFAMAGSLIWTSRVCTTGLHLVAGRNFGCGLFQRAAPTALNQAQVSLVVANGFARIFRRNAINIGLPVWSADLAPYVNSGDLIEVDLENGTVLINGVFDAVRSPIGKRAENIGIRWLDPACPAELGIAK
jgi:3-isopropylmalate dehydratase small subunit